jgi:hypothetical protein
MTRQRAHRRSQKSKAGMHQKPGGGDRSIYAATAHIPPEVLDERERRAAALPRDLTGALQGDPPRGFSELDRRT